MFYSYFPYKMAFIHSVLIHEWKINAIFAAKIKNRHHASSIIIQILSEVWLHPFH